MNMERVLENGVLTVSLKGKLDTGTAPQTEKDLAADVAQARQLVLDMKELRYLSSAGLRMILKLHKTMQAKEGMTVRNVNEDIMEIFDMTGFTSILRIE